MTKYTVKYTTQFKKDYNIEVTILDYGWYQQAVFENGCYDIAIQALNLDSSLQAVVEEGPNDKLHKQEIKELENKIADMQKVQHLNTDYVDDLLQLAILERTISDGSNHSKLTVKSRFNIALSEAEKHGLSQQIFNIHYQIAWTEFYWNEDPDAMLEQYDILKKMIIEEINRRFYVEMNERNISDDKKYQMSIIKDGQIHMCNLAIYTCFSVNGVAALHTEILKNITFKDFYSYMPNKFNNKTNGVTHRRWLINANPELANLISSKIGDSWITNMDLISKFNDYENDIDVLNKIGDIKYQNKLKLAEYVKEHNGLIIDTNSIFDVQIKRLHAYKRQLLNIFRHISSLQEKI